MAAAGSARAGCVVRCAVADDRPWIVRTLHDAWGATTVARLGRLVDAEALPALVAVRDGTRAGLLTHALRGDELEVVTVQADPQGTGTGRALMDAVLAVARDAKARRLWLVTTNDNVRAISFYQRWGMDLVALHRNAVAASRVLKPSIPEVGAHGVPIRHEIELELVLEQP